MLKKLCLPSDPHLQTCSHSFLKTFTIGKNDKTYKTMSHSSDTDANGSVIFVAEQHTVRVDVHPVSNPPNPTNIVPETQYISSSNSASNNPEEDFIHVDTIPETPNFSNATGKYQPLGYLITT